MARNNVNTLKSWIKKYTSITVLENTITITQDNYISLTDMLKAKDAIFLFLNGWETEILLNIWEFGSGFTTRILFMAN